MQAAQRLILRISIKDAMSQNISTDKLATKDALREMESPDLRVGKFKSIEQILVINHLERIMDRTTPVRLVAAGRRQRR
jgi:hypothetical protein